MGKKYLLLGNPNVGKTTVFNNLTGLNEKISNFDGVTVSKKEGTIKSSQDTLIDLPGLNNLNDNAKSSRVVSKTLIADDYEAILYTANILSLKKNMYMLLDILETKKPVYLLLSMTDLFKGSVDQTKLEEILNLKMSKITRDSCVNFKSIKFENNNFEFEYDKCIEKLITKILKFRNNKEVGVNSRYLALQLIRGNNDMYEYFVEEQKIKGLIASTDKEIVKDQKAHSIEGLIFLNQRKFIIQLLDKVYKKENSNEIDNKFTKTLDKIALHKVFGYVLFGFIMWLVFLISFQFAFLGDWLDIILQQIVGYIDSILVFFHTPTIVHDFLVGGVLAGVTSMLVFLPQILILFSVLTILEGCGYFTRVTVLFESTLNKLGLSANSIIPLISGLGCNVLSIMSTRTIKNEHKRIATILAAPYISCSARLPVYLIFIDIFFKSNKALILLSIYILGIIVAISVAYIIDRIVYKTPKDEINISQLVSYKAISLKYFLKIVSKKIYSFIVKAGKLIVLGTSITWILLHFGMSGYTSDITQSFLYDIAIFISYILKPLGFGTIQASASLLAAFFAKELAIAAMVVSYGASSPENLSIILEQHFTWASAYSFMVFTLIYIPCVATLGAIYSETKKISLVVYSIFISLIIGYIMSFIIYNILNLTI